MSVTKNKPTTYHETEQDVKFKLTYLRIDNIDAPLTLTVGGGFNGRVGTAEGVVERKQASFTRAKLDEHFTTAEKTAAKTFAAACERVLALQVAELADEPYDDSDVM